MLGSHRLRLRTATGISDLRPFFVGALPEIVEKEPNSDFAAPQPIPMNVTVNGTADNEDVDYYVVEAKKGDRISAEVEGIRLGVTLFDVFVAIMNPARFELSSSDDNALVWQDGIASIVAPEDGKYIIQVRESSYAGNGACLYRVHIGNFPRPVALLPAGGRYGETLPVKFIGDVLGDREATFALPTDQVPNFPVFAKDDKGIAPSQNWFRLSDIPNVIEQEPNETHDNATRFAAPMALNGVIGAPADNDNYRFTAKKGEAYDIRVHARSIRSPLDPVLAISAAGGGVIAANDDTGGPDSYIRFGVPNDGDYLINVRDHLNNGGAAYVYRVELTPIKPKLVLSTNEFVQYVQPTVSIPKGNHFGLVLSASRFDFGGALALRGENLPAGVTIESPGMPANASVVPVIFHATPDAAAAGKLAEIIGALNDPNQPNLKIEGSVQQPIVLVRGQNQIPFWTENTTKLPIAVTEERAFEIAIVEPKVPLVRGGQMELKVVAKPQEGVQGANQNRHAVVAAGNRSQRLGGDCRRAVRSRDPHECRRQRRAGDVEDRRARGSQRRQRQRDGLDAVRQPADRRDVHGAGVRTSGGRAGERDRDDRPHDEAVRFPRRRQGQSDRTPQQGGDDDAGRDDRDERHHL